MISVSQLASVRHVTTFVGDSWKVTKGALVIARGKMEDTLYSLNNAAEAAVARTDLDAKLWHQRLGHMSERGMKSLLKSGKLPGLKSVELDFCDDCVMGKLKKTTFLKVGKQPKAERLDLVHTDVWGPAPVASMGGSI